MQEFCDSKHIAFEKDDKTLIDEFSAVQPLLLGSANPPQLKVTFLICPITIEI